MLAQLTKIKPAAWVAMGVVYALLGLWMHWHLSQRTYTIQIDQPPVDTWSVASITTGLAPAPRGARTAPHLPLGGGLLGNGGGGRGGALGRLTGQGGNGGNNNQGRKGGGQ